jgi:hypothetical protein
MFQHVFNNNVPNLVSRPRLIAPVFAVFLSLVLSCAALRSLRFLVSSFQVSGVVETTRPDARNAQYAAVIKDGDALLNRVQKLSRVISY